MRLSVLALALLAAPAAHAADPVVLLLETGRREVPVVLKGGVEMMPLEPIVGGLALTTKSDAAAGSITLGQGSRTLTFYDKKTLASLGGDLRLLSAPALLEQGRWLVPVDSVARLFGPFLGKRAEWRAASRTLLLGNVAVPVVTVRSTVAGESARIVFESTQKVPFKVFQEEGKVTVSVGTDAIDTAVQQERLTGGIVEWVRYQGGRDHVFAVGLGRRFREMKAFEQESPPQLVLEFTAGAQAAAPDTPAGAAAIPRPPVSAPAPESARTVVIDPGHGGPEVGALGPEGTLEKDVTLAVARRLRATLQNTLGLQVFLTRDRDSEVPLDDRAAFANNYKADLFVSIHANASRASSARGSEVYYLAQRASDEESRRLAAIEGAASPLPEGTAPTSDLALILWDMAQAEHLAQSAVLATRIQEELAEVTGSDSRGVKQAPFRVLVGAAMPAVLVELAFISNPEEEKLLVSDAHQAKLVSALTRGISRYLREREGTADAAPRRPGPG